MMRNYKLLWGMIIFLLLVIVTLSGFLLVFFNRYADFQQAQEVIMGELSAVQAGLEQAQQTVLGARNELAACEHKLIAVERKNSLFELAILTCEEDLAALMQAAQEYFDN